MKLILGALIICLITFLAYNFSISSENSLDMSDNTSKSIETTKANETVHYNITIAPDLSNRVVEQLYPKPISDLIVIGAVFDNIYPKILTARNRLAYQNDIFRIDLINRSLLTKYQINTEVLKLDFKDFKGQRERIEYLNGKSQEKTFNVDKKELMGEIGRIYDKAAKEVYGADIWTYLNTNFHEQMLGPELVTTGVQGTDVEITQKYKNVLILLTDGYIETGFAAGSDKNDHLSHNLTKIDIDRFRDDFLKNGKGETMKSFFEKMKYGLVPVDNKVLSDTEILVLELYDRSLSKGGSATTHPTDYEILHLFWSDWLEKSGVKRFAIYPTASSKQEVESYIFNFLGV